MTTGQRNAGSESAGPPAFHATALAVSFTVKDVQSSMDWYHDVLGFAVDQKHEREGRLVAASLKAGAVRILVGQDDGKKGWDRTKGEGFSVRFTTEQDIDELARGIRNRGGKLESEPEDTPWGTRVFRLIDPDGFKLVISSEAATRS